MSHGMKEKSKVCFLAFRSLGRVLFCFFLSNLSADSRARVGKMSSRDFQAPHTVIPRSFLITGPSVSLLTSAQ